MTQEADVQQNVTATMFPAMRYQDAARAIDWLIEAFGFEKHLIVPGDGGTIAHAELRYGPGIIMLGSMRDDHYRMLSPIDAGGVTAMVNVVVEDPDAHYARAKAAGAEIVSDLANSDYGSRGYAARDLEGHLWGFATYRPEPIPDREER